MYADKPSGTGFRQPLPAIAWSQTNCVDSQTTAAVPFSLLLNFTTVLVAVFSISWLKEIPSRLQWFGTLVFLVGVFVYFSPTAKPGGGWLGFTRAGVTVLANAVAAILGRSVNRGGYIAPLVVTATSMGTGALILLGSGIRHYKC